MKKIFNSSLFLLSTVAPLATVISCGVQSHKLNSDEGKTINFNVKHLESLIHFSGENGSGKIDNFVSPTGLKLIPSNLYDHLSNGDKVTFSIKAADGYKLPSNVADRFTLTVNGLTSITMPKGSQSQIATNPSFNDYVMQSPNYLATKSSITRVRRDSIRGETRFIGDINPYMYNIKIGGRDHSYWDTFQGDKYTITGIGDIKFSVIFDKNCHVTEADQRKLIDKFIKETNWGVGMLSLRNIFIVNGDIDGAIGIGSDKQDLLVTLNDLNIRGRYNSLNDKRMAELQVAFATMQHEYGHHETMTMYSGYDFDKSKGINAIRQTLVDNHIIGYQIAAKVISAEASGDVDQVQKALDSFEDSFVTKVKALPHIFSSAWDDYLGNYDSLFRNFNTDQDWKEGHFDFKYQFDDAEFLNRFINVMEMDNFFADENKSPLDAFLYMSPAVNMDALSYALNDSKIFDGHGKYTTDALEGYKLYEKYVYGFNNPNLMKRLLIDDSSLRGYSKVNFDFIKVASHTPGKVLGEEFGNVAANQQQDVIKIRKMPTHFFTKQNVFGAKTFSDSNGFAYFAGLSNIDWNQQFNGYKLTVGNSLTLDPSSVEVFRDSNGDGIYEPGIDLNVTNEFKQNTNFDVNTNNFFATDNTPN